MINSRCSGSYYYQCNQEAAGVEEHWQVDRSSSTQLILSRREVPAMGIRLEVNSAESAGDYTQCIVQWQIDQPENSLHLQANYEFLPDQLRVTRHMGAQQEQRSEPIDGFVFSPLMRIYNGAAIRALQERGPSRVLTPWIRDHQQQNKMLWPLYSERKVELLGEEYISVDGVDLPCQKFEYSGGEYGAGTQFWLDEHDVMTRYSWQQDPKTRWDVLLQNYQRED